MRYPTIIIALTILLAGLASAQHQDLTLPGGDESAYSSVTSLTEKEFSSTREVDNLCEPLINLYEETDYLGWDFYDWFGGQPFLTYFSVKLNLWNTGADVVLKDACYVVSGIMQDNRWWPYAGDNNFIDPVSGDVAHCAGIDGFVNIEGTNYPYYYYGDLLYGGSPKTRTIKISHPTGHNSAAGVGINGNTYGCVLLAGDGFFQGVALAFRPSAFDYAPLEGCMVTASQNGAVIQSYETGTNGRYQIIVPSGNYDLTATYPGLHTVTFANIDILPGDVQEWNFLFSPCFNDDVQCLLDAATVATPIPFPSPTDLPLEFLGAANGLCNSYERIANHEVAWGTWTMLLTFGSVIPGLEIAPTVIDCFSAVYEDGNEVEFLKNTTNIIDYWLVNPLSEFAWEDDFPRVYSVLTRRIPATAKTSADNPGKDIRLDDLNASLHILDTATGHTGMEGDEMVWGLPDVAMLNVSNELYWTESENHDSSLIYRIVCDDVDTLSFSIGFSYRSGYSRRVHFDSIVVAGGSVVKLEATGDTTDLVLELDYDGDDVFETDIVPSIVETPPRVPMGLSGHGRPEGLYVEWEGNTDPDLSHYTIYRGNHDQFQPTQERIVGTVDRTAVSFLDPLAISQGETYFYCVTATDSAGAESGFLKWIKIDVSTDVTTPDESPLPCVLSLRQNHPNPFNPSTRIEFKLPERTRVCIDIFNIYGQKVCRLVDGERTAGIHSVVWDGQTDRGQQAATGVYFYRIEAEGYTVTKKMLLLK